MSDDDEDVSDFYDPQEPVRAQCDRCRTWEDTDTIRPRREGDVDQPCWCGICRVEDPLPEDL